MSTQEVKIEHRLRSLFHFNHMIADILETNSKWSYCIICENYTCTSFQKIKLEGQVKELLELIQRHDDKGNLVRELGNQMEEPQ